MEDVLDLYEEPYDPQYPTVCLDEKPVVLHADVQPPVPVEPGQPERIDYEYERRGTRKLFVMVEPRAGFRHVEVTAQRTSAATTRRLVRLPRRFCLSARLLHAPRAGQASTPACRPPSTKRSPRPKRGAFCNAWSSIPRAIHGSWLNMAEIEIAILERNALSRRVAR